MKLYNLGSIREGMGLSRRELARRSGVSLSTVYRIEKLETEAREQTMERLSEALDGIPMEELAFPHDHEFKASTYRPTSKDESSDKFSDTRRKETSASEQPSEISNPEYRAIIGRLDEIISLLSEIKETQLSLAALVMLSHNPWGQDDLRSGEEAPKSFSGNLDLDPKSMHRLKSLMLLQPELLLRELIPNLRSNVPEEHQ